MTVIACPEPGCPGVIEDGYCTETGLAYPPPASGVASDGTAPGGPGGPEPINAIPATTNAIGGGGRPISPQAMPASAGPTRSSSRGVAGGSVRSRPSTPSGGRRRGLGAGIVQVPELPAPDPTARLLTSPSVPEHRRFCPRGHPVGRARGGRPGRTVGFCGECQAPFSFVPALRAGDTIGGYEIAGALAHGGQGWIYLARDRSVADDFWVVLKGLLDEGDPDARAAAIAERRFLATVDHPGIVKIFTFVEHGGTGYIVMEYVGGTSLRDLLKDRRAAAGRTDPLPAHLAISYILAVLPAFTYLHRAGLVFCDFKPDNVMLSRDTVKLIDLGAVRHLDQQGGAVYGTKGYQAPEVSETGPSLASDLYTVGRTLAALLLDFRGNTSTYRHSIPPAADHPALARYDSLYRFLVKATAVHPDDRFVSAEEMHDELEGVLREVGADVAGRPFRSTSRRFTGDAHPTGRAADGTPAGPPWVVLPVLLVDDSDPAAIALARLPAVNAEELEPLLTAAGIDGVEVRLRLIRAQVEAGRFGRARDLLDALESDDPWEWRAAYYRGMINLAEGDTAAARGFFDRVYAQAPGELAPKLALAHAAEADGDLASAERLYNVVSSTDDTFTSAAFGLARVRAAVGDRVGAVAAYRRVAPASAAYVDARAALVRLLGTTTVAGTPSRDDLAEAARVLETLDLDGIRRVELTRELLTAAVDLIEPGPLAPGDDITIAGRPLRGPDLRLGLEQVYRQAARLAGSEAERHRLVQEANRIRPWTLV
ncbi:Serine/threonine-protein kinase PknG [Frankia sp. AiPs1]|uniref:serine/threonine-protein kinase n=1 Tax=Frankia sp. AiPa1 TaxID=573492 RepID=UPI00202B78C8|nr:serine/threonine-protein kinase [Frankia sp. AiPa1]MCL9759973.1 serine/threonine-protein kinase PknG [Frankia sp. AiPa1]